MSSNEHAVGIFTTDSKLAIRSWDEWMARATGIESKDARGHYLPELFPEVESRGLLGRFRRVIEEGVVEVLAPAFHRYLIPCAPLQESKRFERMQQRATLAPLKEKGSVVGVIVTIEDVTARLEREREINEWLKSANEDERLRAAQALREESLTESDGGLVSILGDASWRVRRVAVDGLSKSISAEEMKSLLRALREEHKDPAVLNSVLQVFALSGVDSIEPLTQLMDENDVDLRIYITHALGDQRDLRAVPALKRALTDGSVNVRYHAIEALGKLRASDAVDELVNVIESRDFFLAFPAIDALTLIGDRRVARRLVPLLEEELLQTPAADALGRLGDADVAGPLAALLNNPSAPSRVIAQSLASLYERYKDAYDEGGYIEDLARKEIREPGIRNLIEAIDQADPVELRSLVIVLGWLSGDVIERALVRLLGQPTARKDVIEALVRNGGRVTELLAAQLETPDLETRKAAVVALGRIGDQRAVPALVRVLESDDDLVIPAAGALGKIGDRRAFEALLGLIRHEDAAVRQAVVAAINSLGHPEMASRAVSLLTDRDPHVRESAVKIAGYFGYKECADLLLERCHDEDESVRRAAIEHIPYLEDERVLPTLTDGLRNGTPRVRAAAVQALGNCDGAEALSHLLESLNDADPWVRYFAARSVARQGNEASIGPLARLAHSDKARQVCIAAIDALGEVGGPRAAAILSSLLESEEVDLSCAAIKSLGKIMHPDALPPLLDALKSSDQVRRIEALNALGQRGGPGVADAIQWVCAADLDESARQAAVGALARLATPEAIAALIALTADSTRREMSVAALARIGDRNIEGIERGLAHPQAAVRGAVADALGRMKNHAASELLIKALSDNEASVRLAAIDALARLGNRSAESKLVQMMHADEDVAVRRAAQRALEK